MFGNVDRENPWLTTNGDMQLHAKKVRYNINKIIGKLSYS